MTDDIRGDCDSDVNTKPISGGPIRAPVAPLTAAARLSASAALPAADLPAGWVPPPSAYSDRET